ncbi:MAG: hypothetical protein ABMB14_41225, partial [Myxococcota bacterium]
MTGGLREGLVRGAALEVAVLAGAALIAVLAPGSFALASALAVLGTPVAGWLVLSHALDDVVLAGTTVSVKRQNLLSFVASNSRRWYRHLELVDIGSIRQDGPSLWLDGEVLFIGPDIDHAVSAFTAAHSRAHEQALAAARNLPPAPPETAYGPP